MTTAWPLVVALSLKLGFWSRPIKGGDVSLGAPSDPNFGWAEKPETATKKPRNLLGFRAQFEEFPKSKHYFRDFSPRRKKQGSVEGAPGVLNSREKVRQEGTSVFFQS
jgi:hypothetical protein